MRVKGFRALNLYQFIHPHLLCLSVCANVKSCTTFTPRCFIVHSFLTCTICTLCNVYTCAKGLGLSNVDSYPFECRDCFSQTKVIGLLGAVLHWRPHFKKPFWRHTYHGDFQTNIPNMDLLFKSAQLYDKQTYLGHSCQYGWSMVTLTNRIEYRNRFSVALNDWQKTCSAE